MYVEVHCAVPTKIASQSHKISLDDDVLNSESLGVELLYLFSQVEPLLRPYLPIEKKDEQKNQMSCNDRLMQLLLKGMLYESCVDYCQQQVNMSLYKLVSSVTRKASLSKLVF